MTPNISTIKMYIRDAESKRDLLLFDIKSYERRISNAHTEIATMDLLIDKYNEAIKILEVSS